jgi:lipopolysaccharide export system permease LptF/LptG-like protein
MSTPGVRLRRLASRVFRPDTMEYVIDPALADLQLECSATQPSRWRQRWVCLHAYWSFWAAVNVHLWRSLVDGSVEATADDHHTARRMVFSGAAIVVIVTAVLLLPGWFNRAGPGTQRTAFDRDLIRALALLIPQATPISIPAGMLFGTLWVVRKPATRLIRRMVLSFGIVCSLFSAGMLGWVIPEANQAYRVVVYQKVLGYGQPPAKGLNELTWHDLRLRIKEANTRGFSAQAQLLRLSYHGRIALVATPFIFAMLALVLVTVPRGFLSWLVGLLLFVGYYTLIRFDRLVDHGTLSPWVVAWTPNIVAILIVMIAAFRRSPDLRLRAGCPE